MIELPLILRGKGQGIYELSHLPGRVMSSMVEGKK
jgi:hypothetical protein